jgi:hypothetical protein
MFCIYIFGPISSYCSSGAVVDAWAAVDSAVSPCLHIGGIDIGCSGGTNEKAEMLVRELGVDGVDEIDGAEGDAVAADAGWRIDRPKGNGELGEAAEVASDGIMDRANDNGDCGIIGVIKCEVAEIWRGKNGSW